MNTGLMNTGHRVSSAIAIIALASVGRRDTRDGVACMRLTARNFTAYNLWRHCRDIHRVCRLVDRAASATSVRSEVLDSSVRSPFYVFGTVTRRVTRVRACVRACVRCGAVRCSTVRCGAVVILHPRAKSASASVCSRCLASVGVRFSVANMLPEQRPGPDAYK